MNVFRKRKGKKALSFLLTLALVFAGAGTAVGLDGVFSIKAKADAVLNHSVTAGTVYRIGSHDYVAAVTTNGTAQFIAKTPTTGTYTFDELATITQEGDANADVLAVAADLENADLTPKLSSWTYSDAMGGTETRQGYYGVPTQGSVDSAKLGLSGVAGWTSTASTTDDSKAWYFNGTSFPSTDKSDSRKALLAFNLDLSKDVHIYTPDGETIPVIEFAVLVDEEHFPDENFRNWVLAQSYGSDGKLTASEIAGVKAIDVSGKSIADLTGIEYFTALDTLTCNSNNLTTLDMSNNIALGWFYCNNNQLATLDVSQNIALKYLDCDNNQLTTLDVNQNTALKSLDCSDNSLTTLDLSNNMALESLDCSDNLFATLKVNFTTSGGGVVTISNGGRGILPVSSTYISSKGITLLNPTADDYTFTGWTTTGNITQSGNSWKSFTIGTGDATITATWLPIYTVTYVDGQGNTLMTRTVTEGSATPAYTGTPQRDGYTFAGWSPSVASTVTESVTYTATWKQNFTVTYVDGQGNTLGTYTVPEGTATPAYTGTPERDGFTFTGWTPDVASTVTESITYTATWVEDTVPTCTITINSRFLDKDGNLLNTTTRTDTLERGTSYTVEAPTVDGYFIVGQTSVNVTVDNDQTIEFIYQQIPSYTVTYVDGQGNTLMTQTVASGSATPAYTGTPQRDGYTFAGWTPNVATTVTESVTYTATWTQNSSTPTTPDYTVYLSSSLKLRWQGISGEPITKRVGNITITYGSKEYGRFAGSALITVDPTTLPDGKSLKVSIPNKNINLTIGGVTVAATVDLLDNSEIVDDVVFTNANGSRQLEVAVVTDRDDLPYDEFFGKAISGSIEVSVTFP